MAFNCNHSKAHGAHGNGTSALWDTKSQKNVKVLQITTIAMLFHIDQIIFHQVLIVWV